MVEGGHPEFTSHPVSWRGIGAARASGRCGPRGRRGGDPRFRDAAAILRRRTHP